MFPGAGAQVYRNEEGEVLGWDYPSNDNPYDPDDYLPNWGDSDEDEDDDDAPPEGWHICNCSEDCGAWEPDVEVTNE